jgi:broad specificity phosphatase PhoE
MRRIGKAPHSKWDARKGLGVRLPLSPLMKIILFRHGEKQHLDSALASDKSSVGLTDLGIIQINKLGNILKIRFPKLISSPVIYSSHYDRAIQSAEIIKSILDIKEIIIVPEFGEFNAYNNYQNPKSMREHLQATAMQNPDWISPETHVSLNHFISDFENKLREIYQQNPNNLILVSTHGAIIRNFIYALNSKFRPSNELILESKIHEGGYTVLNFDGQNFTVDQFDVHDYLPMLT